MSNAEESKAIALAKLEQVKQAILGDTAEDIVLCFNDKRDEECSCFLFGDVRQLAEIVLHLSDVMKEQIQAMKREAIIDLARDLNEAGLLEDRMEGLPEGVEGYRFTKH